MKAERLLEISLDLKSDLAETRILKILDALTAALQNQTNTPNETHQKAISDQLAQLYEHLEKSRVNSYPPSWVRELERLKLEEFFGKALSAWVKSIFERNQITLNDALRDAQFIRDRIKSISDSLNNLTSSLINFGFDPETLKPNEYEITIEIPRATVKNEFGELGREFTKLDRMLSVFCEIATGSRTRFQVRAISSSQLTAFLDSIPAVAVMLALCLERMVTIYGKVLNIVVMHRNLAKTDLPKEVLDKIQDHIGATVKNGIEEYAKEFESKYFSSVPKTRRTELDKELRDTLADIARRLDVGYGFDVRGGPPPQQEGEEESSSEQAELNRLHQIVVEARQKIRLFKPEGEPILRLPEPADRSQQEQTTSTTQE